MIALFQGTLYSIQPIEFSFESDPKWKKVIINKYIMGYGWDEIIHPTSKRELLEIFSEQMAER